MSTSQTSRRPRLAILGFVISLFFLVVALMTGGDTAEAKGSFLGDFNALYGTAGTPLDSCAVCHPSIPQLNSYASDWKNNGKSFGAIEQLDSDNDGWTNIAEINARTFPGDPNDTPGGGTTTTTTTTQPPVTTTTTTTTTTTLPPGGGGPLDLEIRDIKAPGSVDVSNGDVTEEITVKARVEGADPGQDLTASIQLYANGQLDQTITSASQARDDGRVDYDVKFDFIFTIAHVPQVDWWATVTVDGQTSSPGTAITTVVGPTPPTTTTTQPPTATTQPPTATTQPPGGGSGATVYAASCAACHGGAGEGGIGGPVAGTTMNLGQVIAITADGSAGMPGFSGQLTTAEIDAVSAFVLTLGGGQPPPTTTTTTLPPGTPQGSGSALYRQHCAACHGGSGGGGIGGPLVGSQLSFAQQVSVTSHGRGTMPGFNSLLTSAEINSITRYVASFGGGSTTTTTVVPPGEESGAAIYGRLCAVCHGANESGGIGGPILDTGLDRSAMEAVITDGVGTMLGFGSELDDGQVALLTTFVEGLSSGGTGSEPSEGFTGPSSGNGATPSEPVAAPHSASPLPVASPLGWALALAIGVVLTTFGSMVIGVMPQEDEESFPQSSALTDLHP